MVGQTAPAPLLAGVVGIIASSLVGVLQPRVPVAVQSEVECLCTCNVTCSAGPVEVTISLWWYAVLAALVVGYFGGAVVVWTCCVRRRPEAPSGKGLRGSSLRILG